MKLLSRNADPKHRFPVFLYLTCLMIALASNTEAERDSTRRQPEFQQSKKKLMLRERLVRRDIQFPLGDAEGYPLLLIQKTRHLLSEAEHMLNRVKNVKERRWVESFIHRLKTLSTVLEGSIVHKTSAANQGINFTVTETSQPELLAINTTTDLMNRLPSEVAKQQRQIRYQKPAEALVPILMTDAHKMPQSIPVQRLRNKKQDSDELVNELEKLHFADRLNGERPNGAITQKMLPMIFPPETAPLRERDSLTPSDSTFHPSSEVSDIVPTFNREQKKLNTNESVTSKFVNYTEGQVSDPLVKELEELRNPATPKIENSAIVLALRQSPPEATDLVTEKDILMDENRENMVKTIIQEIHNLEQLGSTPEEIVQTLGVNFVASDIEGTKTTSNKSPSTEIGHFEMEKNVLKGTDTTIKDINSDKMISRVPTQAWKPSALKKKTETNPSKEMYKSYSFQERHLNLPQVNQNIIARQLNHRLQNGPVNPRLQFSHPKDLKDAIKNLQRRHENFLLKNHALQTPQISQDDQHDFSAARPMKPNQFYYYDKKYNSNPSLDLYRSDPEGGHNSNPHGYFSTMGNKTSTFHRSQVFPTHNLDNKLSDEMKRQLRYGKVILLSDNVVPSNFEPSFQKEIAEKNKNGTPYRTFGSEKNETQAEK